MTAPEFRVSTQCPLPSSGFDCFCSIGGTSGVSFAVCSTTGPIYVVRSSGMVKHLRPDPHFRILGLHDVPGTSHLLSVLVDISGGLFLALWDVEECSLVAQQSTTQTRVDNCFVTSSSIVLCISRVSEDDGEDATAGPDPFSPSATDVAFYDCHTLRPFHRGVVRGRTRVVGVVERSDYGDDEASGGLESPYRLASEDDFVLLEDDIETETVSGRGAISSKDNDDILHTFAFFVVVPDADSGDELRVAEAEVRQAAMTTAAAMMASSSSSSSSSLGGRNGQPRSILDEHNRTIAFLRTREVALQRQALEFRERAKALLRADSRDQLARQRDAARHLLLRKKTVEQHLEQLVGQRETLESIVECAKSAGFVTSASASSSDASELELRAVARIPLVMVSAQLSLSASDSFSQSSNRLRVLRVVTTPEATKFIVLFVQERPTATSSSDSMSSDDDRMTERPICAFASLDLLETSQWSYVSAPFRCPFAPVPVELKIRTMSSDDGDMDDVVAHRLPLDWVVALNGRLIAVAVNDGGGFVDIHDVMEGCVVERVSVPVGATSSHPGDVTQAPFIVAIDAVGQERGRTTDKSLVVVTSDLISILDSKVVSNDSTTDLMRRRRRRDGEKAILAEDVGCRLLARINLLGESVPENASESRIVKKKSRKKSENEVTVTAFCQLCEDMSNSVPTYAIGYSDGSVGVLEESNGSHKTTMFSDLGTSHAVARLLKMDSDHVLVHARTDEDVGQIGGSISLTVLNIRSFEVASRIELSDAISDVICFVPVEKKGKSSGIFRKSDYIAICCEKGVGGQTATFVRFHNWRTAEFVCEWDISKNRTVGGSESFLLLFSAHVYCEKNRNGSEKKLFFECVVFDGSLESTVKSQKFSLFSIDALSGSATELSRIPIHRVSAELNSVFLPCGISKLPPVAGHLSSIDDGDTREYGGILLAVPIEDDDDDDSDDEFAGIANNRFLFAKYTFPIEEGARVSADPTKAKPAVGTMSTGPLYTFGRIKPSGFVPPSPILAISGNGIAFTPLVGGQVLAYDLHQGVEVCRFRCSLTRHVRQVGRNGKIQLDDAASRRRRKALLKDKAMSISVSPSNGRVSFLNAGVLWCYSTPFRVGGGAMAAVEERKERMELLMSDDDEIDLADFAVLLPNRAGDSQQTTAIRGFRSFFNQLDGVSDETPSSEFRVSTVGLSIDERVLANLTVGTLLDDDLGLFTGDTVHLIVDYGVLFEKLQMWPHLYVTLSKHMFGSQTKVEDRDPLFSIVDRCLLLLAGADSACIVARAAFLELKRRSGEVSVRQYVAARRLDALIHRLPVLEDCRGGNEEENGMNLLRSLSPFVRFPWTKTDSPLHPSSFHDAFLITLRSFISVAMPPQDEEEEGESDRANQNVFHATGANLAIVSQDGITHYAHLEVVILSFRLFYQMLNFPGQERMEMTAKTDVMRTIRVDIPSPVLRCILCFAYTGRQLVLDGEEPPSLAVVFSILSFCAKHFEENEFRAATMRALRERTFRLLVGTAEGSGASVVRDAMLESAHCLETPAVRREALAAMALCCGSGVSGGGATGAPSRVELEEWAQESVRVGEIVAERDALLQIVQEQRAMLKDLVEQNFELRRENLALKGNSQGDVEEESVAASMAEVDSDDDEDEGEI